MVDVLGLPQRLEQRIAEAQRQQVLHRLLAEVVVDAEGLVLVEGVPDRVVDLLRAGQVASYRFFDDHARVGAAQAVTAQAIANTGEQIGAGRQIEHAHAFGGSGKQRGKIVPAGVAGHVELAIVDQFEKPVQRVARSGVGCRDRHQFLANPLAVLLRRQRVAGSADDAAAGHHLPVGEALEQRRQQLAPGKVAGAAEYHQIEWVERQGL